MPGKWIGQGRAGAADPAHRLRLWPHRELTPGAFCTVIVFACGLCSLPVLLLLGTPVVWFMLPFLALAVGGLWHALRRSMVEGRMYEELCIWPDRMTLERVDPWGRCRRWEGDPYWVRVDLARHGGPVEDYLTLSGSGRSVELGAFLTAPERKALYRELAGRLATLRGPVAVPNR